MSAPLKSPTTLPDPNNLRAILAYNIKILRIQKGWSQEYLAHECELDRTYISAVERCKWNVSLSTLETLARVLDVSAYSLLQPPQSS